MDSLLTKVLLSTTREYEGVLGGGTAANAPARPVRELAPEYAAASPETLDLIESVELLPWGFHSKSSHVYLWNAEETQRRRKGAAAACAGEEEGSLSLASLLLPSSSFDEGVKSRFYATHPELRGLETRGLLFAGSSVLHAAMRTPSSHWMPGDVDIFMCRGKGGGGENMIDRVERILEHLAAAARTAGGGGSSFTVKATRCVITVGMEGRKYQIVLREYGTPTDVLRGFDIGACQVGFSEEETDGEVVCTEAAAIALKFRLNVFDVNRMSRTYVDRLHKYATRGFGIVLPFVSRRDLLLGSGTAEGAPFVDLEYFGFNVAGLVGSEGVLYTGALVDNLTRAAAGKLQGKKGASSWSSSPYGKMAGRKAASSLAEIGTMREACVYNERLIARNLRALRRREVGEFPGDGGTYGVNLVRRALFESSAPKVCQFLDVSFRPAYLQREGGALITCETGHRVHAMRGCDVASTIAELLFFLPGTDFSRDNSRWKEYFALRLEAHYRRTTTVAAQLDAPAWMGIRVPRLVAAAKGGASCSTRGEGEEGEEDQQQATTTREEIAEWIHQECKREVTLPLSLAYGSPPRFSYPTVAPAAEGGSGVAPSTQFFQVRTTLDRVYRRRKQTTRRHDEEEEDASSAVAASPLTPRPSRLLPLFGGSSAATLDDDRPPSPCVSTGAATAATSPCYSMYDDEDEDDGEMPRSVPG